MQLILLRTNKKIHCSQQWIPSKYYYGYYTTWITLRQVGELMSIYRVQKNKNYVTMNRTALNDKRLSWKAKGIMAYMLSMPDDWVFYIEELTKHSTDGEKAFRTGFKELKDNGYVQRQPIRDGKKIVGWDTVVHEVPQTLDNTLLADFVHVEKVDVQKEGLLSTDFKLSTDNTKQEYSVDFLEFWSIYPNNKDKKQAYKAFKKAIKAHSFQSILDGAKRYSKEVQGTEQKYIKHASTFLNNESFINEETQQIQPKKKEQETVIAGMWGMDLYE